MKENKYDTAEFFDQYSTFPRSVEGLDAAGEWHELQKMLPDLHDTRVLDIGCGFGWHCIYAAEHGARQVVGIDISEKMLAVAREKTSSPVVTYRCSAMEDADFGEACFDVALSSLVFHYTPDFSGICKNVYRALAPQGVFVFSVEHPIFTAEGRQDWIYSHNGSREYWPVDRYFSEGERKTRFLGCDITKYHRTLTAYVDTLLGCGFSIRALVEPMPAEHLLHTVPGMQDELRRPMMLLIAAVKNA